jgi:hypothetical protein
MRERVRSSAFRLMSYSTPHGIDDELADEQGEIIGG